MAAFPSDGHAGPASLLGPKPAPEPVRIEREDRPWPEPMGAAVRVGIVGEFLDLVVEQTEADPAAIVADLLVRVGSAVHRGPHFRVSGDRHGCNLFVLVVGATAQGRKGSSAAFPSRLMEFADSTWCENCVKTGLSSGEGIIHGVRDPVQIGTDKKTREPTFDEGVTDKRLLAIEPEFARTMRAAARRESTLGPILRQAWEGARHLAALTKQPYGATDAHVALLAHVTPIEFRDLLNETDISGGTFNRFLFIASRRQRELPFGGEVADADLERLGHRLQQRLDVARRFAGAFTFTPAARAAWPDAYADLQRDEMAPGIVGELLARGTAQVRRLAMIFAIVDGQQQVDVRHVEAAREVWRYSKATVGYLFGTTTGNRVADRILAELRTARDGVDRTAMFGLLDRHVTAEAIDDALALLDHLGLAHGVRIPTGGRPREVWRAGRRQEAA